MVHGQLRQKIRKNPLSTEKAGHVGICQSSLATAGSINKRIAVQAGPDIKQDSISK
jgi:hypothetical protein